MTLLTALISRLPHWRILLVLLALSATLYAGWHARGVVEQAGRAEELERAAAQRKKQEEDTLRQSAALEQRLAAAQMKARQLSRRLTHELQNPGYDCPLPPLGLQLRSDALAD